MASLYRDRKSPYWYLKKKGVDGVWRVRSTKYRHGVAAETRKAREQCAAATLEESRRARRQDVWVTWVPDYIRTRYLNPSTRRRVFNAWARLYEYFTINRIYAPQNLTRADCLAYMETRKQRAAHNTARLELKILSLICEEACRRDIIRTNPAAKLGIGRVRGKERPELSDDDITKIRTALRSEPAWMSHAFEIALHQGCRLSETDLIFSDVDLHGSQLHFRRTKGDKPFSVPMHPNLKPVIEQIVALYQPSASGRILNLPPNAARDFHRFFKKLDITAGATFSSTRVTVASRLARAGYPLSKEMRVLNHGSELVHRQYQRLQAEDVADAYDLLKLPPRDKK
jgi:hypothetical protein